MEDNGPFCYNCPHFAKNPVLETATGKCHHNPPQPDKGWASVDPSDWCSRHPDRVLALQIGMGIAMSDAQQQMQQAAQRQGPRIVPPQGFNIKVNPRR